jgi:hypothetical protein
MIAAAKTPADYKAVVAFYQEESTRLQKEADQHAGLAKQLTSEAGGQRPSVSHHYEQAEHCRKFADLPGESGSRGAVSGKGSRE